MDAAPRRSRKQKQRSRKGPDTTPGLAARRAAAGLLALTIEDGEMLAEQTSSTLSPSERARAQTLARLVLRNLDPIDRVLALYLKKPPKPGARHILRIAAAEMILEDVPPHAAVDAAVRLAQESKQLRPLSGLINAVGRKLAAEGKEAFVKYPIQSLPGWIEQPVKAAYTGPVLAEILKAHRTGAPLDLTLKSADQTDRWAEELNATRLPTGSLRLTERAQVSELPGYAEGAWWVQDAAAALPVRMLGEVKGNRVLDLCAAPGGKSLQLVALGAEVTALDISEARLRRVQENLERTGLAAKTIAADALTFEPEHPFDIVLLDAPCSATGTIRRHPDLPHVRTEDSLSALLPLQAGMLDKSARLVAPGGRLLYCTCSLFPAEGEEQADAFLSRHPDFTVEDNTLPLGCSPDWQTGKGHLRLLPSYWADTGGMDGFFATVFRRTAGQA